MNKLSTLLAIPAMLAALLLAACGESDSGGDEETFSVQFSVVSVPDNLTLDSLEIQIALGDTGTPKALTINRATGTSSGEVLAYPGQKYSLTYVLYASGFDIGRGEDTGTLAKDMKVELEPEWNQSKIESAKNARASGKLLPAYLGSTFGQALAGKPVEIKIDSAAGYTYTWYVRVGDSTVVSGSGTKVSYTPADSLAGTTINIKLVVKKGNTVAEERAWDVKVLGALPSDRLVGVITKTDTTSRNGSYTRFKYNGDGKYDSILVYDTAAFVAGREPVAGTAITYTQAHNPGGDPSKVVSWVKNQSTVDSIFSYDSKGRLSAVTVTVDSAAVVDSFSYPSEKTTVIRSLSKGKVLSEVRHVVVSATAEVDSIFGQGDSGLTLTGMVKYDLAGGKVTNERVYRKFGTSLSPVASEWTYYNALGSLAFRNYYQEQGATLVLDKSEAYSYKANGLLDRILHKDEVLAEVHKAEYLQYESAPAAKPGAGYRFFVKATASQMANRERLSGLAQVRRLFPVLPSAAPR